jgi:hypothetical protein
MSVATPGKVQPLVRPALNLHRGRQMISNLISARPRELMGIYLNDHLAGAVAGSNLARRCMRNNAGTRYAEPLRKVAQAIAEDRRTLEQLMTAMGVTSNPAKQLTAFAAERIARLKPNGRLITYSPLSRIVEFDGLSAGVNGKRVLWLSLLHVADHYPAVDPDEMKRLIARADEQLETIQDLRDEASVEAFVEP